MPPFDYNGFAADLEFIEGPSSTQAPANHTNSNHHHRQHSSSASGGGSGLIPPPALTEIDWTPAPAKFSPCDKIIIESNGRSGHFDTRGRPFAANCRIIFKGRSTDVVHISLFNYRLKAQACRSVIEIVDGALETQAPGGSSNHKKSLHKMCSPIIRHARDPDGNFLPPQTFVSTGSQLMIALRRFHSTSSQAASGANGDHNEEFVDGAYMFHDGKFF